MLNTLIRISYDGTNYSGFQFQANARTVQETLELALKVIYKKPVRIIGAGRTDAGVHARGQVANFQAPFRIDIDKLPYALNAVLPSDVVIVEAMEVAESFHSRYDARRKIYTYTIDRAVFPQVKKRLYSFHLPGELDLVLIDQAIKVFEGSHDFKYFQAAGSRITDTVRTIYCIGLEDLFQKQLLHFYFEGSGFLYRMVRLISGTLIRVGKGQLNLNDVQDALAGNNVSAVGPAVPACGLCLEQVIYDFD